MKKQVWIFYCLVGLAAIAEIYWLYKGERDSEKEGRGAWLEPIAMREDIAFFFSTLKAVHPDLYVKYDSVTFLILEEKMKEACSSPKFAFKRGLFAAGYSVFS